MVANPSHILASEITHLCVAITQSARQGGANEKNKCQLLQLFRNSLSDFGVWEPGVASCKRVSSPLCVGRYLPRCKRGAFRMIIHDAVLSVTPQTRARCADTDSFRVKDPPNSTQPPPKTFASLTCNSTRPRSAQKWKAPLQHTPLQHTARAYSRGRLFGEAKCRGESNFADHGAS